MFIETMSEEQLEAFLSGKAERLGYNFRLEQMGNGHWSAMFTAPAEKPDLRPFQSEAEGPDRKSALQVLAYVIAHPGVKAPRRPLSP